MIIREMILFSLLCLGALFFNSSEFVDTGIAVSYTHLGRLIMFTLLKVILLYIFIYFRMIIWNILKLIRRFSPESSEKHRLSLKGRINII